MEPQITPTSTQPQPTEVTASVTPTIPLPVTSPDGMTARKSWLLGLLVAMFILVGAGTWYFLSTSSIDQDTVSDIISPVATTTPTQITTTTMQPNDSVPDLSSVTNTEAKALIEKYQSDLKPRRDALRAQIPGGVITYKDGVSNVSAEIEEAFAKTSDELSELTNKLMALDTPHDSMIVNVNTDSTKADVYVNGVIAVASSTKSSTSRAMQLKNSESYVRFIFSNPQLGNPFVLKSGVNDVKVVYTKEEEAGEISVSFAIVSQGATSSNELLRLENPEGEALSGELTGSFTVK